ncbi:MAG: acyl-CoA dehydrogenase family protein [Deltaproteobacteria bacterium]|nr:acyl-CoA dehydrogenase family protein [Deltaproteobacteria bacterium]
MSLDLSLNEDEEILKSAAMNFLQREVPKDTLQSLLDSDTGYTAGIWKKAVEMGWMGILIPEEYGGTGYPLTTAGVLFEALGTGPLPGPYFSSGILGSLIIMEAGSSAQKEDILPDVSEGKIVLAPALTEAEYGWTDAGIKTVAEEKNGDFELNGTKLFIPEAQTASHFIVLARTGTGLSLFFLDSKTDGVSVRRLPGYLAGRSFEVRLNSVKVSKANLLGEKNQGWQALERAINKSIPVLCAYKVGGCQAAFEIALDYSRVRVQFGQPIGRFQRVQDMIIEMVNHVDAARWTTYEALWKLDTQRPASESIHLAKAVASEAYWQVCTLGHRAISGISYSMEHPLAFHTRTSRYLYNYLGEPAFHRHRLAQILTS